MGSAASARKGDAGELLAICSGDGGQELPLTGRDGIAALFAAADVAARPPAAAAPPPEANGGGPPPAAAEPAAEPPAPEANGGGAAVDMDDPLAVKRFVIRFATHDFGLCDGKNLPPTTFGECFEVPARYELDEHLRGLGAGAFGFVAEATDKKEQKKVAIKKLKDIFSEYDPLKLKSTMRELKLLQHFSRNTNSESGSHPDILRVCDVFVAMNFDKDDVARLTPDQLKARIQTFGDVYIVLDRYDMSLKQVMNAGTPLGEGQRAYITFQVLRGLKAVFSANVVHRDMKPENVLINIEACKCAICDFGSGRGFDAAVDQGQTAATFTTTQWYRPPEAFLEDLVRGPGGQQIEAGQKDMPQSYVVAVQALDMWSCGAILAEMMTGKPLCQAPGNDMMGQLRSIFTTVGPLTDEVLAPLKIPAGVVQALAPMMAAGRNADLKKHFTGMKGVDEEELAVEEIDMVVKLMRIDPKERINCDAALDDVYFTQYDLGEEQYGPACTAQNFGFRWEQCSDAPRSAIWDDCCQYNPALNPRIQKLLGGPAFP